MSPQAAKAKVTELFGALVDLGYRELKITVAETESNSPTFGKIRIGPHIFYQHEITGNDPGFLMIRNGMLCSYLIGNAGANQRIGRSYLIKASKLAELFQRTVTAPITWTAYKFYLIEDADPYVFVCLNNELPTSLTSRIVTQNLGGIKVLDFYAFQDELTRLA
jgi:hypothetical protein